MLGGILEKTMETNHYKTTAYAIRIGDEWFAGFGGKPGQESLTKVRPGLCDAKLVWDERKAAAYVERLRVLRRTPLAACRLERWVRRHRRTLRKPCWNWRERMFPLPCLCLLDALSA